MKGQHVALGLLLGWGMAFQSLPGGAEVEPLVDERAIALSTPTAAELFPVSYSVMELEEAQTNPFLQAQAPATPDSALSDSPGTSLDLPSDVIENSPVLQRWLQEIPDVRSDIRQDPSFRSRLRLGYTRFPSTDDAAGVIIGIEDGLIGRTGLAVSGDYQRTFDGEQEAYGSDLRYYVRPLRSYVNIAPVIGYRHLETDKYTTDGVAVGVRLLLALSRTGAADISLTQTWVAPGTDEEVGMTTLSVGYALTRNLRVAADVQTQNARRGQDSRLGVVLEWML